MNRDRIVAWVLAWGLGACGIGNAAGVVQAADPVPTAPPGEAAASGPASAGASANNAAAEAEAAKLVEQLGDEQFLVREAAMEKLMRMGLPSLKAIEQGSRHVDREVRYRCERILVLVRQLEFEKRLDQFLNDSGTGSDFEFPGWDAYRKMYGDSRDHRLLFVDMHRAEPELMASLAKGKGKVVETITARGTEIQQTIQAVGQEVPLGTILAMLFVGLAGEADTNQQAANIVYNFCYQQSFRNAIMGGKNKDLLRKMLGAWIRRGDDWIGYQGMMLSLQYDLPDGLIPAEKMLRNENTQPHLRQYAIVTVAKLGNEGHVPLMEKLLTDDRVCGTWQFNNVNINTKIRDVALAALVHMTKQDHKQFGFDRIQMTQPYIFNPHTAGFEKDEQRAAAFKKWEQYRAEAKQNPKP